MSAKDIDDYLAEVEEPKRSTLEQVRQRILEIVPNAEQTISYGFAWGHDGYFVEVTFDDGRDWWQSGFNGAATSVRAVGTEIVLATHEPGSGNWTYVSRDGGRVWHLTPGI